MARCPAHDDHTPSLSVTERNGQVLVCCHAGCSQEAVLDGLASKGFDLRKDNGAALIDDYRHPTLGKPSLTWPYHDATGTPVGHIVRFEIKGDKEFRPLVLKDGRWRARGLPTPRPLFNLPAILERRDAPVLICEGEKTSQAASERFPDVVVTTSMHGAKSPHKTDWTPLKGRAVTMWPDHDEVGTDFANKVAQLAWDAGASSVRIVQLPGNLPKGWDLADDPPAGLDLEQLLAEAVEYVIPQDESRPTEDPILTRLCEVAPEDVRWLWFARIPLGKLTILDGDPGLGKSLITLDIAARVSTGREMPDHTPGLKAPAGVVLVSCEDDLADTIRPRLDVAGSDVARIVHWTSVLTHEGKQLPTIAHVGALRNAIEREEARLCVIDPLMAHLPPKTDAHKDQQIRGSLAPLAELAAETGAAILIVRHLNKTHGRNVLYRGGGSIGIIGAVRSGLVVAPHPEDETQRVLAQTKSNLSQTVPSMMYSIVAVDTAARIEWGEATSHTAAMLMAQPTTGEEQSALGEAVEFLRELLGEGPVPVRDVKREARAAGISEITLRRAKDRIGVCSRKEGKPGVDSQKWVWAFPERVHGPSEGDQIHEDDHLRGSDCHNYSYSNDLAEGDQMPEFDHLRGEDLEAVEERAAIMEYDGGLSREEAERAAWKRSNLRRHP